MAGPKSRYTPFLQRPDAAAGVDLELGRARGDVAGHEVAERRVAALEVVVALAPRGCRRRGRASSRSCGTQMRPSLRSDSDISVSFDWNSSLAGMHVGWIWVKHGLPKAAPLRCARQIAVALRLLGVGREVEDVAVATGGEHDGVGGVAAHLAGVEVAGDDAARRARPSRRARASPSAGTCVTVPAWIWRARAW